MGAGLQAGKQNRGACGVESGSTASWFLKYEDHIDLEWAAVLGIKTAVKTVR